MQRVYAKLDYRVYVWLDRLRIILLLGYEGIAMRNGFYRPTLYTVCKRLNKIIIRMITGFNQID